MEKEHGKISMRLFKKEKVKPRSKSITVIDKKNKTRAIVNQMEILFDPVFNEDFAKRLSIFFSRWELILPMYPITLAFYQTNDVGFIKLFITFKVRDLLDDIEIKHFFKTVQDLLTDPHSLQPATSPFMPLPKNDLVTAEPVEQMVNRVELNEYDSDRNDFTSQFLKQDSIIQEWQNNHEQDEKALMDQLSLIEKENRQLQQYLDKLQQINFELPTVSELSNTHSTDYFSATNEGTSTWQSSYNSTSKSKEKSSSQKDSHHKENKRLRKIIKDLENEAKQLRETIQEEQLEKTNLQKKIQLETKELESKIFEQEQKLVIASADEFKYKATIEELTKEKDNFEDANLELKQANYELTDKLSRAVTEKASAEKKLEEQETTYWDLEKKLKEWINKSHELEVALGEEKKKIEELNQGAVLENEHLVSLNTKLNDENIYLQEEANRLMKEVNRLSDRVVTLQHFVDQSLLEEQEEILDESSPLKLKIEDDSPEMVRKKYDENGILKLFQEADDAEAQDMKVPIDDYREYRLSLKFLEYRWYQANIMQMNATGKSELTWSEIYVNESSEFFEDLEDLVKIPLLSKKYVIMDNEVLLRLQAYQALSDYLERRYFRSSKDFFDREKND